MSLGYTGVAHLAMSDGESALYTYACQNLNVPDNNPVEDGEIYVEFEPIASARKIVRTKRYPDGIPITRAENIDLAQMLEDGTLKIKNCSNATLVDQLGVDRQALILFDHIALEIQRGEDLLALCRVRPVSLSDQTCHSSGFDSEPRLDQEGG